jgi:hypothetical protein
MHQGHLTFERRPIELFWTAPVNIIFLTARPRPESWARPGPPPGPQEMEAQARPGRAQVWAFRPSWALQNTRSHDAISPRELSAHLVMALDLEAGAHHNR